MKPAEQCEECAWSHYDDKFGICRKRSLMPCAVINFHNDCGQFEHPVIRTRCVEKGDDDATTD